MTHVSGSGLCAFIFWRPLHRVNLLLIFTSTEKPAVKLLCPIIFAAFFTCSVFAQDADKITDDGNNELKVNLAYLLFEIVELNYERLITDEIGVGLGASYWFGENAEIDYMFNPYFRFYPIDAKRRAASFFIEGNAGIVGGTEFIHFHTETGWGNREDTFVRGGAGIAVGAKFLSKGNFLAEGYLGIGRIFGTPSFPDVFPRVGVTFGKRF